VLNGQLVSWRYERENNGHDFYGTERREKKKDLIYV